MGTIDWEQLRALALGLGLPRVEETTSWGQPTIKAHGKVWLFWSPGENCPVLKTLPGDREMLIEGDPETFYVTPHYQPHDLVLIRKNAFDLEWTKAYLQKTWEWMAPKRFLKKWKEEEAEKRTR